MTGTSGCCVFSAAMIVATGLTHQRSKRVSGSIPAQVSNNWTASAPASIWRPRNWMIAVVSRSIRGWNPSGSIILAASRMGQIFSMIWAARLAQNAVAAVFGIFGGFWLSYAALVLGLTHGWFGITAANVVQTEKLFLLTWLITSVLPIG